MKIGVIVKSFTVCMLAGTAVWLIVTTQVAAQNPVDRAAQQSEQIRRERAADERRRREQQRIRDNRPPQGTPSRRPALQKRSPKEACIEIATISVKGVTLIDARKIDAILHPYRGKCLSLSELNNILKQLTFVYVEKGYITSRAYLPEQNLADGALEIAVVEGTLGNIVLDKSPGAFWGQIATAFPGLKGKVVNLRDLEQGLDQLNRLRSNNATLELAAGDGPGESVLLVERNRAKNWYAFLSADNLGTRATGKYQSRMHVGLDDLLGLNDYWYFDYQRSMDDHPAHISKAAPNSDSFYVGGAVPLGYWTFAVDASWSAYNSQIPGTISSIDTSGKSRSVTATVARTLHRDQQSKTSVEGAFTWKENENFILGSRIDVSSRVLSIGGLVLTHSRTFLRGQLALSAGYYGGLDIFGAFDDSTAPAGSPKGQFNTFTGSVDYHKPFRIGALSLSYYGSTSGQWSPDPLFGSEQMVLGGYSTVRGLREAVLFGNRAVLSRHELALRMPAIQDHTAAELLGQMEPYAALDFGHVFKQARYLITGGNLTGVTMGLRSRGGRVAFDLSYSDIVSSNGLTDFERSRSGLFHASANVSF